MGVRRYDGDVKTLVAANDLGNLKDCHGEAPRTFAMQVSGIGGTPTHWNVTLLGSIDGVKYVVLATHTDAGSANADGDIVYVVDKPMNFFQTKLNSVTLTPATGIRVSVVAVP